MNKEIFLFPPGVCISSEGNSDVIKNINTKNNNQIIFECNKCSWGPCQSKLGGDGFRCNGLREEIEERFEFPENVDSDDGIRITRGRNK